ncbi:hypothetical protein I6F29_35620 [Bradyrhizobium sp. NBAIM16]|uniref:hypothetical protein n=1 Tax=Bradyrhizobium sp. NBAIM16 TaxID=2793813 RepID=UPI001CD4C0D8|nr:hypothetical protein [Bradyrhizobium sp. NBAIM16]MCA1431179.1 hypothetical protein [Bradyrhizobium sp. NBAIM16]
MVAKSPGGDTPLHQFVCLPNKFLHYPPIRSRGEDADVGVGVFECAVLGAILLMARSRAYGKGAYGETRHTSAFKKGKEAIQRYKPKFKRGKKQTQRDFDAFLNSEYRNVGGDAYWGGQKQFELTGPLDITVTKVELLLATGQTAVQADKGENLRELGAALARLTKPIVKSLPPLLQSIKAVPNGKLCITVDPKWLPNKNYGRVLWPPPKNGSVVLALYLFLAGCRLRAKTSISLEGLYQRIGIRDSRPSHARRALERAMRGANAHLSLAHDAMESVFPRKVERTVFERRQRIRFSAVYSASARERVEAEAELQAQGFTAVDRVRGEKQAGREVGW